MLITEGGLLLGTINPVQDPPQSDDYLVAQQFPEPGAAVPPGSLVDLLVVAPTDPCP